MGRAGRSGPRPAPKDKPDASTKTRRQPPYNVIVLNDEEHTFEYVIELLTKLFGHSLTLAETLTWRIHNTGRAIVLTTHKELAELKCEQVLVRAGPPDERLQGSARVLHRAGAGRLKLLGAVARLGGQRPDVIGHLLERLLADLLDVLHGHPQGIAADLEGEIILGQADQGARQRSG